MSSVTRAIYAAAGWTAVGLAFLGAFTPGLPTTVFVLIASYCFARSSPRFERWLGSNRMLGPSLCRFREAGGMSRTVKGAALVSMWTAIALSSLALLAVSRVAPAIVIASGAIGTFVILFGVRTVDQ